MLFLHKRKRKYDWEKLVKNGNLFLRLELGHVCQQKSIHAAACQRGLSVSVRSGFADGVPGFLVVLREKKPVKDLEFYHLPSFMEIT
jgi:hypothetical protein